MDFYNLAGSANFFHFIIAIGLETAKTTSRNNGSEDYQQSI
jgi:hypothetical protein